MPAAGAALVRCPGGTGQAGGAPGCRMGLRCCREMRMGATGQEHVLSPLAVSLATLSLVLCVKGWVLCSTVGAGSGLSGWVLRGHWTWRAVTPLVQGWDAQQLSASPWASLLLIIVSSDHLNCGRPSELRDSLSGATCSGFLGPDPASSQPPQRRADVCACRHLLGASECVCPLWW